MVNSPIDTPSQKWACESKDCDKVYAGKYTMKAHFKKCHKTDESVQSPLGRFPSARVLFNEVEPAVQGNSAGQVNSPQVVSEGRYICDVCEKDFGNMDSVNSHKKEDHPTNSDESEITENAMIAEELEEMVRKVRLIYGKDCHNCNMREEVIQSKKELLVKKDADIEMLERRVLKSDEKKKELKKDVRKFRHTESEHKKEMKKCIDMLAESNEKIVTLTTELATKNSMERINEDDDGDQQIKCDKCDFNSRNSALFDAHLKFKHGPTNRHVCTACDMICKNNDDLELHLVKEHQDEVDCLKCNAVFRKEADVYAHSNTSCGEIIPLNTCNKCNKDIVSKVALKKHTQSCKGKKKIPVCDNGDHCRWYKNN